jgi:ribonucleotide reductase beta subunit family protein with ferritin-like domain
MSTKEVQEQLANSMRHWQKIEDRSVESTGQVIAKTENPLIRLVMEIVQRDSQMHHRVQQFIIDTIENKPVSLTPEEMGKMIVQEYLLNFLVEDEKKHAAMLHALDKVKKGMYPYG